MFIKKAGVKTHILVEEKPLGTAGAIKNAKAFLDDVFLVLNADILADIDISEMYEHHIKKRALVTIAVKKMKNCSAYGVVHLNNDGYIGAFIEKPGLESGSAQYVNAGIYIIDPVVLQEIPDHRCLSIERELFPLLVRKGFPLTAYDLSRYWIDVGTPDRYLQAHIDILDGKLRLANMSLNGNRQYISHKAVVHPKAKIVGPVYIGDNVVIEGNTLIGPYAAIYSGSRIGSTAKIRQSVIWPNTNVEDGSTVIDSIIHPEAAT